MPTVLLKKSIGNYFIQTDVFYGPLDLLLQLIENQELDISQLSLANVTDQFLQHINRIENRDPVEVSAFLVIAAQLLLIKSKILLPKPSIELEEGGDDPGEELVKRLIVYKKFKEISQWLKDREAKKLRSHIRLSPSPDTIEKLDLSTISLNGLTQLVLDLLSQKVVFDNINNIVTISTVTIRQRINKIIKLLNEKKKVHFSELISIYPDRLQIVITFLALLELVKNHLLVASQENTFADISLESIGMIDQEFNIEL